MRLRSRIATRSHFIAVRLSGLITAAHKRTHPIALSYLGGDLRFIAFPFPSVPFTMSCHFICVSRGSRLRRTKEAFITTLLRATRTLIAMNPRIFSHCPLTSLHCSSHQTCESQRRTGRASRSASPMIALAGVVKVSPTRERRLCLGQLPGSQLSF